MSIEGRAFETAVLDQQQTASAERARQPRREAVRGQVPRFRQRARAIGSGDQIGTLPSLSARKIAERDAASVKAGLRLRSAQPNCAIAIIAMACAARSS
jgi:hypothetical protein